MSTKELVYRVKLELDKLDSEDFVDLGNPTILVLINKVILVYIKEVYGLDNRYKLGFEGDQNRIDQLQVLTVKDEPNFPYTKSDTEEDCFVADFSSLVPAKYLHLARSISYADKDTCKDRALYNQQTSHDDLDEVLADPNQIGSFEWQELPIVIAQNKIWGYTDGTFTPTEVHMEFLKYPLQVDIAGYEHIDGSQSEDVDSELPNFVLEDIIPICAKIAKIILEDNSQTTDIIAN